LHVKRLSDIDLPTLKFVIRESVKQKKRGAAHVVQARSAK
jgi:hypothetical protein